MTSYNRFIVRTAKKHKPQADKVGDFGAGIGTLALILRERFGVEPICIETDGRNQDHLQQRKFTVYELLPDCGGEIDLIFSSNVLEHTEDDVSTLRCICDGLSDEVKMFLYLPAKMLLWSKLDEDLGQYRRYEYAEIKEKCAGVGLEVEVFHFSDSLGLFPCLMMKVVGYNMTGGIGSVASLKIYDRWLFPRSMALDWLGLKHLFGKNLVVVAHRA